ncbi:site-specific integrase [Streptomyces sp. NPDC006333]|uniref:site-specific integrase n=1 Tax=Streptomyces sp. NPDC006333 TaxID=3156753 RepID=UPI0033A715C9
MDGVEWGFFVESLVVYRWAREAAGLASVSVDGLVRPVVEVCEFLGVVPWRLTACEVDGYFAGSGRVAAVTVRSKMARLDAYFEFLRVRFGAEVLSRFGVVVRSPVDVFNRPRHRGDFGVRVPPSRGAMEEFFARWRRELGGARKFRVGCRDYVMAKIAYVSGVRAGELCGVRVGDVLWEQGRWGRFLVRGKGARGSGPRVREAFLFAEGRELLWWYVEEVRGLFGDDPEDPRAPLWPSERRAVAGSGGRAGVCAQTFRRRLGAAAGLWLEGPVTRLHPHLLRHACATHHYERGMSVWEVQRVLGHAWASTTVRYLATVRADPEAMRAAGARAAGRLAGERFEAEWGVRG